MNWLITCVVAIALLSAVLKLGEARGYAQCRNEVQAQIDTDAESKRHAGRAVEQKAVTAQGSIDRTFTDLEQEARDVFTSPRISDPVAARPAAPAAAERACLDPDAVGVWNRAVALFRACTTAGGDDCAVRPTAGAEGGHGVGSAQHRGDDAASVHRVRASASGSDGLDSVAELAARTEARTEVAPTIITGVSDDELAEALDRRR